MLVRSALGVEETSSILGSEVASPIHVLGNGRLAADVRCLPILV
jgi:hypothetical protein